MELWISRQLRSSSAGFFFLQDATFRHNFMGSWNLSEGFLADTAYPELGPNLTVVYELAGGLPPAGPAALPASGGIDLSLVSTPIYSIDSIQSVKGELSLAGHGAADANRELLSLPVRGHYFSDAGVLLMLASKSVGTSKILPALAAFPSPSGSPTVGPSASPSQGASPTPSGTSSPSPSASGKPAVAGDIPMAAKAATTENGGSGNPQCVYAIALRFRPTGFDGSWAPAESGDDSDSDNSGGEQPPTTPVGPLHPAGRRQLSHPMGAAAYRQLSDAAAMYAAARGGAMPHGSAFEDDAMPSRAAGGVVSGARVRIAHAIRARALGLALSAYRLQAAGGATRARASLVSDGDAASHPVNSPGRRLAPARARRAATTSPAPYAGARFVPAYGVAVSWNCNVTLNISAAAAVVSESAVEVKALGYALLATMAGVTLTGVTLYQLIAFGSQASAVRVSLGTVAMQAVLDAYATLAHATGGLLSADLFSSFATTAFIYLTLFAVLEMRLLLNVWKAHRPELFASGWEAVRKAVFSLYCRFYGVLIGGVLLVYIGSWGTVKALALVAFSYWVPQIAHCVAQDCRPGLSRRYIAIVSAARLAVPLYFLACPANIAYFMVAPESRGETTEWAAARSGDPNALDASGLVPSWRDAPWMLTADDAPAFTSAAAEAAYWSNVRFAVTLVLWTALQAGVLLLQGMSGWGPRFFVPHVFLPARYDYHRRVAVANGRVVASPLETHPWVRHTSRPAAATQPVAAPTAPAAADGAAAPPPPSAAAALGQYVRSAARGYGEWAVDTARQTQATAVWFAAGCRLLAAEWAARARQVVWKGGAGSASGNGNSSRLGSEDELVSGTGGSDVLGGAAPSAVRRTDSSGSLPPAAGSRWVPLFVSQRYARLRPGRDSGDDGAALEVPGQRVSTGSGDDLSAAERGGDSAESTPGALVVGDADGSPTAIDCAICMDTLQFPLPRRAYMVTPCDHLFHAGCLRQWFNHKLECPTCRMPLPEPGAGPTGAGAPGAAAAGAANAPAVDARPTNSEVPTG